MARIETVFFDMGGTLETLAYDDAFRRSASEGLLAFLVDRGLDPGCSAPSFHEGVSKGLAEYRKWNAQSLLELSPERICSEYILQRFGLPQGRLGDVSEQFMFLLESRFYDRQVRPEAASVVRALHEKGLKLGIISNIMSESCVPHCLERYGLSEYFDVIIASSVYGRRKPDPRIFLYAAQRIGSPPERCAHVGDKISRDILGARRAGLGLAVLIAHPPVDGIEPSEPAPDAFIQDLGGLVEVLETAEREASKPSQREPEVKALFFDAGDILYYRPRRGQHIERFMESLPQMPEPIAASELKEAKDRAMRGEISKREYMLMRVRALGIVDESQLDPAIAALQEEADDVGFFDRARETLLELKRRGYLLGIITDTYHPKATKLEWLRRNGIDQVWDVFVSSCEEGVRKPSPGIYEIALERLGISSPESAFVGHKKSELDGATAVGMRTVAFNYEAEAEADDHIERFDELLALFPSKDGKEHA